MQQGFPPLARLDARILILGSMPGEVSLQASEYYAHPRNAFWQIMGAAFGASPQLAYEQRTGRLLAAGVALWDVVARCRRSGSLDADIEKGSVEANDFSAFFQVHRSIRKIVFNGAAAEALFRRHVRPQLSGLPEIPMLRLPSTSPANAGIRPAEKQAIWLDALTMPKS